MRVAIVHDDLVQWGGAEKVLLGICELFPDAPIYTAVINFDNNSIRENFKDKKIITSFMQKIPFWKSLYKNLLPIYPVAFEQFNFDKFDLVISHTTRFAKSIITKPETLHVSYCHTPPRFLWHFSGITNYGIGELLMSKLRVYDQIASSRVDQFIAGSENAKKRIKKIYKKDSKTLYPFIDLKKFEQVEIFDGGYFVTIGRSNKYKRFDLALQACEQLGRELKIINGSLSDDLLVKILSGCKALIVPGEEDFGLASIEAQALGKPVIAYRSGGSLETVIEDRTGVFFDNQTVDSLKNAILKFEQLNIDQNECKQNSKKFSKDKFVENFKQILAPLLYT